MERAGIAADTEWLAELEARFAGEVKRAAELAYAAIGHEVNLGSPKQLQEVLFDELGAAEDQEDQDRLHHRRRRAGRTSTRRPSTRSSSTCCATATSRG